VVTPTEKEVLLALQERGDDVPANIAEHIDRHAKYVTRKLADMEGKGIIENKGRGVYSLTPDGRELARKIRSESDSE
jgi:DNA-binding MarR family transcriptional regulator